MKSRRELQALDTIQDDSSSLTVMAQSIMANLLDNSKYNPHQLSKLHREIKDVDDMTHQLDRLEFIVQVEHGKSISKNK